MTRDDTTQASGKVNGHPTREGATRQPGDGAPPTSPALMTRAEVKSINEMLAEYDFMTDLDLLAAAVELPLPMLQQVLNAARDDHDLLQAMRAAVALVVKGRRDFVRSALARMGVEA